MANIVKEYANKPKKFRDLVIGDIVHVETYWKHKFIIIKKEECKVECIGCKHIGQPVFYFADSAEIDSKIHCSCYAALLDEKGREFSYE